MHSGLVRGVWVVLAIVALTLIGCGGPKNFSPEDFEKIQNDMTEAEVRERLGGPSSTSGKGEFKTYWYENVNGKYYGVGFKDGKVTKKNQFLSKDEYNAVRQYA